MRTDRKRVGIGKQLTEKKKMSRDYSMSNIH